MPVNYIVLPKKVEQMLLLHSHPQPVKTVGIQVWLPMLPFVSFFNPPKKPGGDAVKGDTGEWVAQQELRTHRPHKPTHIARVPLPGIDAVGDQPVAGFAAKLHCVCKAAPGGEHPSLAQCFSRDDSEETQHPWYATALDVGPHAPLC